MRTKTDNPTLVGVHCFEAAGLGKAPFRFVGFYLSTFKATPESPTQPGTSCDYCGTAIMNVCRIKGVDGGEFKVGCNCVDKVGDAGLMRAYKNSPEYRKMLREKASMKDQTVKDEMTVIMNDPIVKAAFDAEIVGQWNWKDETRTEWFRRMWDFCGAAGRGRYLKLAKQMAEKIKNPQ